VKDPIEELITGISSGDPYATEWLERSGCDTKELSMVLCAGWKVIAASRQPRTDALNVLVKKTVSHMVDAQPEDIFYSLPFYDDPVRQIVMEITEDPPAIVWRRRSGVIHTTRYEAFIRRLNKIRKHTIDETKADLSIGWQQFFQK
jgi:hypothetical protein